jgi:DNA polymerase III epsilon subunit-like protein
MGTLDIMLQCQQVLLGQPVYLACQFSSLEAQSEIVEIAILDTDERVLLDELVRPRGPITPEAAAQHGITADRVHTAPGWGEVWPKVRAALGERTVGAYGRAFYVQALRLAHQRNYLRAEVDEEQFFCIQQLFSSYKAEHDRRAGGYRTFTLLEAAEHLGLDTEAPFGRRAADDARLTRAILLIMAAWKSGSSQVDLDGD